jgi:hypothetical protein
MTSIIPDEFSLNREGSRQQFLMNPPFREFSTRLGKGSRNRGCAGVDGESIDRFARNQTLILSITRCCC